MKFTALFSFLLLLGMILPLVHLGQEETPYHLNGNARQENCNCYTITPDEFTQSGSIWNINKINLTQPFEFNFNVFLGCSDAGADGIAFVLQPISTSVGSTGGGLGYEGIQPSIGIAIDTWVNSENNDPGYDHISIHRDGNIIHGQQYDLAGPEMVLDGFGNIEDCAWHVLSIRWDPVTHRLSASIDGKERVVATVDLVAEVFNADPMVFWGFTGATGGAKNHQRVCTSLNPGITLAEEQITCYPEPILFKDSSTSFGSILEWNWDFGDGTTFSGKEPPPHVFPAPGVYDVKMRILGSNGCLSEPYVRRIVAGTIPEAVINAPAGPLCDNSPQLFTDQSTVEFGTINSWTWTANEALSTDRNLTLNAGAGTYNLSLQVKTQEGCVSELTKKTVRVFPTPEVDFTVDEECAGSPATFTAAGRQQDVISAWRWAISNGTEYTVPSFSHIFREPGTYEAALLAVSGDGCLSPAVTKTFTIHGTNAFAGNDTLVANHQPLQLNGQGGTLYNWSPATGLNDPNIPNPVAVLEQDMTYILTASTPEGCPTSDTINIKVFKGPTFYFPNAFTPNNDGHNDKLQFIAAGISELDYFHIYNRYGQLIFRSTSLLGFWDGRLNGKDQSSGTYVYTISGKDYTGVTHTKKGSFLLIR